jgi:hypothetical protein
MKYKDEIRNKLEFINEILNEIKIECISNNADFIIDDMSTESWLKFNLQNVEQNKAVLSITFTLTEIEIKIDRISEAINWSNKDLVYFKESIKKIFTNLLTNYVLVQYFGSSKTRISLFDNTGNCNNIFNYTEGISFKLKQESRLYFPIYSI